jgi:hypothetical protein
LDSGSRPVSRRSQTPGCHHHRADHDAHRTSTTLLAETSVDDAVTDEEDRSADQHPDSELEAAEVLRFGNEVEGDRFDQCTRAEAGEHPDELRWEVDPVHQEPTQEQRGLCQCAERDRLQHPDGPYPTSSLKPATPQA